MSLLTMQTCAKLDIHKLLIVSLHMFSTYTDCIGSMCININIYIYTNPVQLCRQDPGDAFDFLDVRSCGTISLREVRVKWMEKIMSVCAGGGFEKKTAGGWCWRCFILTTIYSPCFEKMLQKTVLFQCFFPGHQKGSGNGCWREFQPSVPLLNHTSKGAYYYMQLGDGPFKGGISMERCFFCSGSKWYFKGAASTKRCGLGKRKGSYTHEWSWMRISSFWMLKNFIIQVTDLYDPSCNPMFDADLL